MNDENIDEPLFIKIDTESNEFQMTIKRAQETLGYFQQRMSEIDDSWMGVVKSFMPEIPNSDKGPYL
ncbi:MAG: hypothetical protein ACFFAS_04935 [Promethearchaeota archaeon]